MWLVIVVALGVPLLGVAAYLDARHRRRLEGDAPPLRGEETVDAHAPAYVTQSEIDALPLPGRGRPAPEQHPGVRFDFGHARPDFATAGAHAVHRDARVLMVEGTVSAMRELLALLRDVGAEAPLVIVATSIHDEVLATLAANRRSLQLPVVGVECPPEDLERLLAVVGGEVLGTSDIKAGYVPASALGLARTWTSTMTTAWVEGPGAEA